MSSDRRLRRSSDRLAGPSVGRLIGIDHGNRWFGLAWSDPTRFLASPLEVCDGEVAFFTRIAELVAEEDIRGFVLGLPLNMDGSEGPKAKQVREFAAKIEARFPRLPVALWDERLTTVEAEDLLAQSGTKRHKRKQLVDKIAARILLQSFLDSAAEQG